MITSFTYRHHLQNLPCSGGTVDVYLQLSSIIVNTSIRRVARLPWVAQAALDFTRPAQRCTKQEPLRHGGGGPSDGRAALVPTTSASRGPSAEPLPMAGVDRGQVDGGMAARDRLPSTALGLEGALARRP
jgi:hypothetical protein